MLETHAVGIDLGTTYSCIARLNEHGAPVTLPNQEGELSTPSVVLFDDDEVVVGTEAQRNAIRRPDAVVHNAKRYIGTGHTWDINGRKYSPVDISTFILKKLLSAARDQIGVVEQAVITVPAQFSDAQRNETRQAGHRAGLQKVDIINEPVAASLCHVLGTEGMWFTELADEQRILVFDLGGGTLDLSVVRYRKDEVVVVASSGDLKLGGIDWNAVLEDAIARQFAREFREDPRTDPESLQFLALEVEQAKRSLSVRPKAALTCQHGTSRKTYQVTQEQFGKLARHLVDRCEMLTRELLKSGGMGWAHIDVVLLTGGSTRMPMVRQRLDQISGTTPTRSLSPDLSIAHGATYYAGMLLSNDQFARSILSEEASERLSRVKQQSVTARGLGILVRDVASHTRVPHYLIAANTALPAAETQTFGTVIENQRRVHLQIVESGTTADESCVRLGECIIDGLPPNLPEGSEIAVTIHYDASACVQVSARDLSSGLEAKTEIVRAENVVPQLASEQQRGAVSGVELPTDEDVVAGGTRPGTPPVGRSTRSERPQAAGPLSTPPAGKSKPAATSAGTVGKVRALPKPPGLDSAGRTSGGQPRSIGGLNAEQLPDAGLLEQAEEPILLCNSCGEPLDAKGRCAVCPPEAARSAPESARRGAKAKAERRPSRQPRSTGASTAASRGDAGRKARVAASKENGPKASPPRLPLPAPPDDDEILDLDDTSLRRKQKPGSSTPARRKRAPVAGERRKSRPANQPQPRRKSSDDGEDEFWQLVE